MTHKEWFLLWLVLWLILSIFLCTVNQFDLFQITCGGTIAGLCLFATIYNYGQWRRSVMDKKDEEKGGE